MPMVTPPGVPVWGRSPHGERGLKCDHDHLGRRDLRRSPHGERGLKYRLVTCGRLVVGRSPHGERGLKSADTAYIHRRG